MKKLKKLSAYSLMLIVFVCIFSVSSFAAASSQDGIITEISADKSSYKETDVASVTVKATNTNTFALTNVTVESILPQGLRLAEKTELSQTKGSLAAGESIETNLKVQKASLISSPQTGENSGLAVYILFALTSAVIIAVILKQRKNAAKIMSLFLCFALLMPIMANIGTASAEGEKKSFTATKAISFSSCSYDIAVKVSYELEGKTTLATPTNVKANDAEQIISWDKVENADGYYVFSSNDFYYTGSNSFSYANFGKYGDGEAKVIAVSKNDKYVSSDTSKPVAYKYTKPDLNSVISTINDFETETKTTYFGMGYNVITSPYINAESVQSSNWIFDQAAIRKTQMTADSASNFVQISKIEGDSLESFMNQFDQKVSAKAGINTPTPWAKFTGSFSAQRSGTSEGEVARHYIKNTVESRRTIVTWSPQPDSFYNYLTTEFKNDLLNNNFSPKDLFDKYGTHIIRSGVLGGKIDFNYELYSTTQHDLSEFSNKLTANISSTYLNFDAEAESKIKKDASAKNVIISTNSTTVGGSSLDMSSLEKMKENYQAWLTSLKNECALIDIKDTTSLYPIWNLIPNEKQYAQRKQALIDYFDAYGAQNYQQLMAKYPSVPTDSPSINIDFMKTQVAQDNNNYNPTIQRTYSQDLINRYEDFKLGNLILQNCKKNSDGTYTQHGGLELLFKLNESPDALNAYPSSCSDPKYICTLSDDTAASPVWGFPNFGGAIGKGAYCVQVTFKDSTTKSWVVTNFLNNKIRNDTVDLIGSNDLSGHNGIKSVTVKLIYEVKDFMYFNCGINHTECPNLISEQTIDFT